MASPQLEDGFIRLSTEVVEALAKQRVSGEEMQCLWVIIRKTYGWNKKEDWISLSQFAELTGINKGNVRRALCKLIDKNMVVKKDYAFRVTYGFQKNYRKWKGVVKKDTRSQKRLRGESIKTTDAESIKTTTIDTITIDTITKDKKIFLSDSQEVRLADMLLTSILTRNPDHKKPNIQTWAKSVDLMIRIDKRDPEEIEMLIVWCQSDTFWQNNILSTSKLRKQYDQLYLKMKQGYMPKGKTANNASVAEEMKRKLKESTL